MCVIQISFKNGKKLRALALNRKVFQSQLDIISHYFYILTPYVVYFIYISGRDVETCYFACLYLST